jgi:hypothetical protein
MLLISGSFMVGDTHKNKAKVSMKLIAALAPARVEIKAGVVAKADQRYFSTNFFEGMTAIP